MKVFAKIVVAALAFFVCSGAGYNPQLADLVLVKKSESRLYLMHQGKVLASFRVSFGSNPRGHKQQQGDGRTPEGRYVLDYKKPDSAFYKAIHISYPNATDRKQARKLGVDPGGAIMIHGQKNGYEKFSAFAQLFNWTNGCIALSNRDMDVVWDAVMPGTPIEILP